MRNKILTISLILILVCALLPGQGQNPAPGQTPPASSSAKGKASLVSYAGVAGKTATPSGYSIAVYFEGVTVTDSLFLLKYQGSHSTRIQGTLMKESRALFRGATPLTPGMYAVELQNLGNIAFLISAGAPQQFTLSAQPARLPAMLRFDGSPENQAFADYQRFIQKTQQDQQALEQRLRKSQNNADSATAIGQAYKKLEEERHRKVISIQKDFPGSMVAMFTLAVHEAPIPDPAIPDTIPGYQELIMDYYTHYTRRHFFDVISFSDPRITHTPLLEQKLDYYFKRLVSPHPDSVIAHIGPILGQKGIHDEVFSQAATYLYELYRLSNLPEHRQVCNHIAEKHILPHRNRFSDPVFLAKVADRTARARLNPVGSVATDLRLQTPDGKETRLSEVVSPLTILYFYNPGCSACQPITDRIIRNYKLYKSRGMEVFAVYLEHDKKVWTDYIASKKLDWINVYDPTGQEMVEEKYDIYAMPMIYVLDRDKRVIARDVSAERLSNFILGRESTTP